MIYLINIGDSRAIIISNDGTVLAHTEGMDGEAFAIEAVACI